MPGKTSKGRPERHRQRRKIRAIRLIAVLLALVGVGMLLYPHISNYYYSVRFESDIAEYDPFSGVDTDALWAAAEEYNRSLAETGSRFNTTQEEKDAAAAYLNPLGNGMMGYIEIPDIDVRIPIYQGTEEAALQAGAGWWIGTSLPVGGESTHSVITAHTGLVKAKMFTDLDQLEIGDTFTLTILDRQLTYEVDQILVVLPDELEPLEIVEGEDYVTLYTCTPYGINTHRLLVRGHRVGNGEAYQLADDNDRETMHNALSSGLGLLVWSMVMLELERIADVVIPIVLLVAAILLIRYSRSGKK